MGLCSFSHQRLIIHFHSNSGLSHVTLFGQQACHVLTYSGLSSCTSAIFVKNNPPGSTCCPKENEKYRNIFGLNHPPPRGPPWPRKPFLCPPTHKKDRINCWFKSLNFGTVYYAMVVDQYHYQVLWLWGEKWSEVEWLSRVRLFATPWTVACQAALSMRSPGKNTGVGCHSLLQGIFLTQGSNPGLPHCRQMLYPLSHQGGMFSQTMKRKKSTVNFSVYLYTVLIVWWNMQSGKPQKTLKLWILLWKILVEGHDIHPIPYFRIIYREFLCAKYCATAWKNKNKQAGDLTSAKSTRRRQACKQSSVL